MKKIENNQKILEKPHQNGEGFLCLKGQFYIVKKIDEVRG